MTSEDLDAQLDAEDGKIGLVIWRMGFGKIYTCSISIVLLCLVGTSGLRRNLTCSRMIRASKDLLLCHVLHSVMSVTVPSHGRSQNGASTAQLPSVPSIVSKHCILVWSSDSSYTSSQAVLVYTSVGRYYR